MVAAWSSRRLESIYLFSSRIPTLPYRPQRQLRYRPHCWTLRGPGVIPLRRRRRRVHRTCHLQLQQGGWRILSQGRLWLPYLRRPRSHGWPPSLWEVERRLDQCPRHVCYPCMVAHWSHQGKLSARRLQPYHLVRKRTTSSAFCSPIFILLLLLRLVYGLFWVTDWYCAERLLPVLMADQSNI